jgi:hypothetical protein
VRELINKRVYRLLLFIHTLVFVVLLGIVVLNFYKNIVVYNDLIYKKNEKFIKEEINFLLKETKLFFPLVIDDKIKDILLLKNRQLLKVVLLPEVQKRYKNVKDFFAGINFFVNCKYLVGFGEKLERSCNKEQFKLINNNLYLSFFYKVNKRVDVEFLVDFSSILKRQFDNFVVVDKDVDYGMKYKVGKYYIVISPKKDLREFYLFYIFQLAVVVILYLVILFGIKTLYNKLLNALNRSDIIASLPTKRSCQMMLVGEKNYVLLLFKIDVPVGKIEDVAMILSRGVRKDDLVCRWSKGEFVLILFDAPFKSANLVANKLKVRLKEHFWQQDIKIRVQVGISGFLGDLKSTYEYAKERIKS